MKQLIQLSVLANLLISCNSFAINNPVQGFYVGVMADISHGPSNDRVVFHEDGKRFEGTVNFSSAGAGGGGMLGYKLSHFRLELELLYNRFSTGPLVVDPGGCVIENVDVVSPSGICTPGEYDRFREKGLGWEGSSAATFGLINFYYDFFTLYSQTNLVPYVGLGIGQARIRNFSNFINTNTLFSHGGNVSFNTSAAQGILGLSYMMDDFTWAGIDYRYTTTKSLPEMQNRKYTLNSINFNINFAFDKGGIDFG